MNKTLPKKVLYLFLLFLPFGSMAQEMWDHHMNFEDTSYRPYVQIVTDPIHSNLWEVGAPQKTVFTQASSYPNVIVTDTNDSYPVSDSSVFLIKHFGSMDLQRCSPYFWFYGSYWVDAEFGADFGRIEISVDHAQSWINVSDVDWGNGFYWMSNRPVLTGSSNGWVDFQLDLSSLNHYYDFMWETDTLFFRFTFISDSVDTQQDGLMFDNFRFYANDGTGIAEPVSGNSVQIYPNPAVDLITLKLEPGIKIKTVKIVDFLGQIVLEAKIPSKQVDVSGLPVGVYLLEIESDHGIIQSKLLKQ